MRASTTFSVEGHSQDLTSAPSPLPFPMLTITGRPVVMYCQAGSTARRLCRSPRIGEGGQQASVILCTLAIAERAAEASCNGTSLARCSSGLPKMVTVSREQEDRCLRLPPRGDQQMKSALQDVSDDLHLSARDGGPNVVHHCLTVTAKQRRKAAFENLPGFLKLQDLYHHMNQVPLNSPEDDWGVRVS